MKIQDTERTGTDEGLITHSFLERRETEEKNNRCQKRHILGIVAIMKGGLDQLTLAETPLPVRQDDFSPGKGNALQACIASLFHLELVDVPNFIDLEVGYEQGIRDFLASRSKLRLRKVFLGNCCSLIGEEEEYNGKLCILRGQSPRGDFGHVVIARVCKNDGFDMVHDPHPDETFLDRTESYGWCMLFDE